MTQLTFEEFRKIVAEELKVDEKLVVPEASFLDDLLVDSLRLVQLLLRLDEMELSIPPEVAWQIETVADAYRCCVEQAPVAHPKLRPAI